MAIQHWAEHGYILAITVVILWLYTASNGGDTIMAMIRHERAEQRYMLAIITMENDPIMVENSNEQATAMAMSTRCHGYMGKPWEMAWKPQSSFIQG
jgi:uncharacterized OB-fold protein